VFAGLERLATESTIIIFLKAMSFATFCGPQRSVEHEPKEEFDAWRYLGLPELGHTEQ
jgi:hypothetical protein